MNMPQKLNIPKDEVLELFTKKLLLLGKKQSLD
jgi:hypothetical protein